VVLQGWRRRSGGRVNEPNLSPSLYMLATETEVAGVIVLWEDYYGGFCLPRSVMDAQTSCDESRAEGVGSVSRLPDCQEVASQLMIAGVNCC